VILRSGSSGFDLDCVIWGAEMPPARSSAAKASGTALFRARTKQPHKLSS
jgi:hypothetical protein